MTVGNLAINAVLVVSTVSGERRDRTVNLIEQGADLGRVIDIAGGQRRRCKPAGLYGSAAARFLSGAVAGSDESGDPGSE